MTAAHTAIEPDPALDTFVEALRARSRRCRDQRLFHLARAVAALSFKCDLLWT